MKALVTGGAGFIGSTLVDALVAEGADVAVVDDLSRGRREQVNPAAAFHQVDIAADGLSETVHGIGPDIVFHHAAQIDVRRSVVEPMLDTRINVVGTVNLLQACTAAGVHRVVFASSGGAIYGDTEQIPTPETHPRRPASVYGAAKLAGEAYGAVFEQLFGLQFVALRYANVYGPRQDPHGEAGVVAIFAERLLSGKSVTINGDGSQTRDYVHVDDVVAANLRAAHAVSLGAYNIGTGREADVSLLYAELARAAGITTDADHVPAKLGEQRRSCLDTTRARDLLGWQPTVPLEEGLRGTLDWFRRQGKQ